METEIEAVTVPGHRHPLWLSRLEKDGVNCKMCEREILSSLMFSCRKCDFFICRSCTQLPLRFNHPFHPHHIVVLCHKNILGCNVCSLLEPGYGYECEQCEFSLHLKCSSLKFTSKKSSSVNSHHQHPLFVCDNPKGYINKCFHCDVVIAEEVYLCIECGFMLDQWCALRPREITHPFHLQHSLKLYNRKPFGSLHCSLCAKRLDSHTTVYSCSSCNFTVDVHCATLFPTAKDSDPDKRIEFQPKTHPHSLIICSTNFNNFASKCYGCGLGFEGGDLIHVCLQCGILLHKSCADLPQEISHPFHPQHSLILFENTVNMTVHSSYYCRSCGNGSGEFVYICRHCDVVLDVKCATAKLHTIFISEIHKHPLAYFDINIRESACNFCHSRGNKYLFRCVNCDFNVHDHCLPSLPQTIKHDCHCDPLTFTTAEIKDLPEEDEEQELYCNACEQSRNLKDPTYFCSECHFVAHVHCVISEILPHLQNDLDRIQEKDEEAASTSASGEKRKDSEVELDELNGEIGDLEEEIDEMAEELKQLYNKRIERVSTMLPIVRNKLRISPGNSEDTSQLLSYDKYLYRRYAKCEVCKKDVSKDLAFACGRCYYVVCRKCASLPSKMKHPFHPQHSIILLEKNSPIGCKACGLTCYGYLYDCEQCGFCLDLQCAKLMPTQKGHIKSQETAVNVMKHPHPLFVCDYPKDSDREFGCRLCFESFGKDDLVYACLECVCLMDKNCAGQPSEMVHPFHPDHHLSLLPRPLKDSSSRCIVCSSYLFSKDVVYYCSICDIYVDFHCASLMPVLESVSLIQSSAHPHPLIECHSSRNKFHHNCYGCGLPFKDAIYACLECGILLHKSCADLPRKISHHFHPQHTLILHENSVDSKLYRSLNCGGCGIGHGDFVYVCQYCDFILDVRCAMADLHVVKAAVHQHSLALVDFDFRYCRCGICDRGLYKNGFRCVPCNFSIHEHCHPSLPKTIKHECHCDPLTFTTKQIKGYPDEYEDEDDYYPDKYEDEYVDDYEYDYPDKYADEDEDEYGNEYRHKEFYCNACEDIRDIADPTYYCAECHFVAHVRCVFSEILPHLEITSEKFVQEVENIKSEPEIAGDNSDETKRGDSNEEEEEIKLQLVQELNKQIITLKEDIDRVSRRIDMLTDKRNEHKRLLKHKLDQKTRLTGKPQLHLYWS